ncbi:MAG: ATP-binding cassette domain-containing protein [Dermatophilaceae bacterium]
MTQAAIEVAGLRKRLGSRQVLDGVDLQVPKGTVLALLGSNGAGKTTTVRILTTLLEADEGEVRVAGIDVRRDAADVRLRIGLAGQYVALDDRLTARENLRLVGTLCRLGPRETRTAGDRLLELLDLTEHGKVQVRHLSGGLRRKVDLAASLLGRPEVLFLDEPTTGLDPVSRNQLWELVRAKVAEGITVLLTTQYLEEADQLADDIAVLDDGQIIAQGPPSTLKRLVGGDQLCIRLANSQDASRALTLLRTSGPANATFAGPLDLVVETSAGLHEVATAAAVLARAGIPAEEFGLRRPTLDDVFIHLTDRKCA